MKAKILSTEIYLARLTESPEPRRILKAMRARGRRIDGTFKTFSQIPMLWQSTMRLETAPEQRERRTVLARRLRSAATQLEKDPDLDYLRLYGIEDDPPPYLLNIVRSFDTRRPTLLELMRDFATAVEQLKPSTHALERRMSLKVYAVRSIFNTLLRLQQHAEITSRRPITAACSIASVLLAETIKPAAYRRDPVLEIFVPRKRNYTE